MAATPPDTPPQRKEGTRRQSPCTGPEPEANAKFNAASLELQVHSYLPVHLLFDDRQQHLAALRVGVTGTEP